MSAPTPAAVLFALPCGLSLGGVTTWAVRFANTLAEKGRRVGVVLHKPRRTDSPGNYELDPRVRRFSAESLAPMDELLGGADIYKSVYLGAIDALRSERVVCMPSLMGDCYGIFAVCSRERSACLRVVGWAHLYSPYELRVLEHYASLISRFVGVSDELTAQLRSRLPVRAQHIENIPYGVEVPAVRVRTLGAAVRIAYVGRLDEDVKRVDVLPLLSNELARSGVAHTITIAGDGPGAARLARSIAGGTSVRTVGVLSPRAVSELLESSDLLVLPSRSEGLPLVLQEAMARGCVPVVCGGASGIAQLVEDAVTGVVVENTDDRQQLAAALCAGVRRAVSLGLARLAAAARAKIIAGYEITRCHEAMIGVIDAAAADPPRAWPADVEPMFTSKGSAGSGTVPSDGAARLRRVLHDLDGRRVLLYGTGRHTMELLPVVREFAPSIIGFIDDDPTRLGAEIEHRPVIAPIDAAASGASDIVISSWIHEHDMWERRGLFERAGMRVHRLYAD